MIKIRLDDFLVPKWALIKRILCYRVTWLTIWLKPLKILTQIRPSIIFFPVASQQSDSGYSARRCSFPKSGSRLAKSALTSRVKRVQFMEKKSRHNPNQFSDFSTKQTHSINPKITHLKLSKNVKRVTIRKSSLLSSKNARSLGWSNSTRKRNQNARARQNIAWQYLNLHRLTKMNL